MGNGAAQLNATTCGHVLSYPRWSLSDLPSDVSREPSSKPAAEDRSWFIESWDNGVITVRHEGKVYKATCYAAVLVNERVAPSYGDFVPAGADVIDMACGLLAVELVGRNVQPFPPAGSNWGPQTWLTKNSEMPRVSSWSWMRRHSPLNC